MGERKLNRLAGGNDSQKGSYFITIFVHNKENVFGKIFNGEMILNEYGKIVEMQWHALFEQHKYLESDEYAIMPNHFHGILHISRDDRYQNVKSLQQLIAVFKANSSKLIHQAGNENFVWQKSHWDEVLHNEKALNNSREYIINKAANMDEE